MLVLSTRWITMVSCPTRETKNPNPKSKLQKILKPTSKWQGMSEANLLMSQTYGVVWWINRTSKLLLQKTPPFFHPLLVPPNKAVPLISAGCCTSSKNCHATWKLWFQTSFRWTEMWFSREVWQRTFTDGIYQTSANLCFSHESEGKLFL